MTEIPRSITTSALMAESAASRGSREQAATLGGKFLAVVQDAVWRPADQLQAAERGKRSDVLAEVAADTLAMLPGVKGSRAGLLRAAILIKPGASLTENATGMAVNFTEGLALNKLSQLAAPGGKVHELVNSRLQSPLAREAASHLAFGTGLGVIKSGFKAETWLDENKQFSLSGGLERVAESGALGGVLNVPAGFLGNYLGRAGLQAASARGMDVRLGAALSGAGSGFASGSVLGGVDAALAGGDWRAIVKGMHEGGLTGSAAGGLGMGLIAWRQAGRPGIHEVRQESERALARSDQSEPLPTSDSRKTNLALKPLDPITHEELRYSVETKLDDTRIQERVDRLGSYTLREGERYQAVAGAEYVKYKDYADFLARGLTKTRETVRVYNVNGVEIVVPDAFARELDKVLDLRRRAAQQPINEQALSAQRQAMADLANHPFAERLHPSDLVYTIEQPNRKLISRVEMSPIRNPVDIWTNQSDAWVKQNHTAPFRSAATAGRDGVITWYTESRHNPIEGWSKHEWAHLLKFSLADESKLFDLAAVLESNLAAAKGEKAYSLTDYARRNHDENFAEHTMGLLEKHPGTMWQVSHAAPLRTIVIARALVKAISAGQPGPLHETYSRRIAYINREVLPVAQSQLLDAVKNSASNRDAARAASLLARFGNQEHIDFLKKAARDGENPLVARKAFAGLMERAGEKQMLKGGDDPRLLAMAEVNQLKMALELGGPGSASRLMARDAVKTIGNADAQPVRRILEDGVQGQSVSRQDMARHVADLQDAALQRRAFQHVLANSASAQERATFVLEFVRRSKDLSGDAVVALTKDASVLHEVDVMYSAKQRSFADLALIKAGLFQGDVQRRSLQLAEDRSVWQNGFREPALEEALKSAPTKEAARDVATIALRQGLNRWGSKVLADLALPESRSILRLLSVHDDPQVKLEAFRGLKEIAFQEHLSRFSQALKVPDGQALHEAAQVLASQAPRSVPKLLELTAAAPDSSRTLGMQAVADNFSPSIYKFYLRQMKQDQRNQLQGLLSGRL